MAKKKFSKKAMLPQELAGDGAPYFSHLKEWNEASRKRESSMRTEKAYKKNLNSQVTPGEWKTK